MVWLLDRRRKVLWVSGHRTPTLQIRWVERPLLIRFTAPTAALGGAKWYRNALNAVYGYSFDPSNGTINLLKGGAGDGTNYGGGVAIVAARYLFGSGTIVASASGNAGGGVVIFISSKGTHSYTLDVSGSGTGSAGTAIFIEAD